MRDDLHSAFWTLCLAARGRVSTLSHQELHDPLPKRLTAHYDITASVPRTKQQIALLFVESRFGQWEPKIEWSTASAKCSVTVPFVRTVSCYVQ